MQALLLIPSLLAPIHEPGQEPAQDTPQLGVELAAVAGDIQVTFDEMDEILVWRHGRSANGREALRSLLDLRVLDHLAAEEGLEVSAGEIASRWTEMEQQVQQLGAAKDLFEYLAQNEITPEVFREHLRLSILHEELTRRALGIPKDRPVSADLQVAWLEEQHLERGVTEEAHPWKEGVVARSGDVVIDLPSFKSHLRTLVTRDELVEVAHLIALERTIAARMPDLSPDAFAAEVEEELGRRRVRVESNPAYHGATYEQLLDAQGLSIEGVRRDPGIRVHALSHLWYHRSHTDETVRAAYEKERDAFDGRYGEAMDVYVLMLGAAERKNQLNPRTFDEADAQLADLIEQIEGLDDFRRLATELSEEPTSREQKGFLGKVTAKTPAVPENLRRAIFDEVNAARTEEGVADLTGTVIGPLRIQGGSLLVCLGARHPAPTWEVMVEHVGTELRRRMREEALPRSGLVMWFAER